MRRRQPEIHRSHRTGWLRAAVLGANDGIVSTASLLIGVASAGVTYDNLLIAGVSSVVAGAMSMAAGEYVSVSSQSDTERADLEIERRELEADPAFETAELTSIYVDRGLEPALARQVAESLMRVDPLTAHARDELGISATFAPRPMLAAMTSLAAFTTGGLLPITAVLVSPAGWVTPLVAGSSLCFLALLGSLAARTGGAPPVVGAARVTFWGALAMAVTAAIGSLTGVAI